MKLRKKEYPDRKPFFEGTIDYRTSVYISGGEVELNIDSNYAFTRTVDLTIKDLEELLASAKESRYEE